MESKPARVQPGRLEQQSGNQQQRARAEETGGLVQFPESTAPSMPQARMAASASRDPAPTRRPVLPLTRQQAPRRNRLQAAQGPRHRTEARDHPGGGPDGQRGTEACRESSRVPTASNHQVRRPSRISAPYASAAPTPDRGAASREHRAFEQEHRRGSSMRENPSARSTPISRVRCSIPSLKNKPVSRRAETIRKKLK